MRKLTKEQYNYMVADLSAMFEDMKKINELPDGFAAHVARTNMTRLRKISQILKSVNNGK